MPAPLVGIAAVVAAVRAARAAQLAQVSTRIAGGIKGAKTVQKVYKQGSAAPVTRTQAEITKDGLAKARAAIGASKSDPKAVARKITQDKAREVERIRKQGRNTR